MPMGENLLSFIAAQVWDRGPKMNFEMYPCGQSTPFMGSVFIILGSVSVTPVSMSINGGGPFRSGNGFGFPNQDVTKNFVGGRVPGCLMRALFFFYQNISRANRIKIDKKGRLLCLILKTLFLTLGLICGSFQRRSRQEPTS